MKIIGLICAAIVAAEFIGLAIACPLAYRALKRDLRW